MYVQAEEGASSARPRQRGRAWRLLRDGLRGLERLSGEPRRRRGLKVFSLKEQ